MQCCISVVIPPHICRRFRRALSFRVLYCVLKRYEVY